MEWKHMVLLFRNVRKIYKKKSCCFRSPNISCLRPDSNTHSKENFESKYEKLTCQRHQTSLEELRELLQHLRIAIED